MGGPAYWAVLAYWETPEDFMHWKQSEDFQAAHMNRPPKEMFTGPNVFEMHEIIRLAEHPTRRWREPHGRASRKNEITLGHYGLTRRMRSSSGAGDPRPSRLLVVT